MRKLCSHPALVLDVGNAAHAAALEAAAPGETLPLRGLQHAPKLAALRELLAQCGIGATPEGDVLKPVLFSSLPGCSQIFDDRCSSGCRGGASAPSPPKVLET